MVIIFLLMLVCPMQPTDHCTQYKSCSDGFFEYYKTCEMQCNTVTGTAPNVYNSGIASGCAPASCAACNH